MDIMQQENQNRQKSINMSFNTVFSVTFFNESISALKNQYISQWIKRDDGSAKLIFTPNPEHIVQSQRDGLFLATLQQADICLPDGIGIVWASRLLQVVGKGKSIGQRISGVDVVNLLLLDYPDLNYLVIGGRSQEKPTKLQHLSLHGKKIAWLPGYENVARPTEEEEEGVRQVIKEIKPDVVFVAFGAPQQEFWAVRHQAFLAKNGVKIVMVVGGAFDMLTGKLARAPKLVRQLGLEWLFRLIQQPWRWKRQLRLVSFIRLTITEMFAS
jgi:N-acetylglucosaminyldiphosphoundecaprenol N-acetyl-beta-D-mannosaminyltransferase